MSDWARLPDETERAGVMQGLRDLVRAGGAADFLHRPVLVPSEAHFPDEWRADLDGARAMLARVLAHARLGDAFDLVESTSPARDDGKSVAAWYAGKERGRLQFGLDPSMLDDAESLAGALVHEVAHAWRDTHGIHREERLTEEQLTDLTAIFLGGGVFVANNTFRFETGHVDGQLDHSFRRSAQLGYVSPGVASFALAVVLRARDAGIEVVEDALERTQRGLVEEALAALPDANEVRTALGIAQVPPPAKWELPAPAKLPATPKLVSPHPDPLLLGRRGSERLVEDRGSEFGLVGALASGGALWAVTTFGVDLQPPVMIGAVVASAIAAFFVGKRLHVERCPGKDCRCPLKPDELVCPACGLVVPPRATKEA
ncbi:MAG: hypothetical protein U0228_26280 [Myxococcaceae bacterium]